MDTASATARPTAHRSPLDDLVPAADRSSTTASAPELHRVPAADPTVRLLGPFGLEIGGESVLRWRGGKARGLFQYLLMHRETPVARERLFDVLWPAGTSASSSSLKVAAHAVRTVLDAVQERSPHQLRLVHTAQGYVLRTGPIWLDVEQFQSATEHGRRAAVAGDHELSTRCYRRAVDLYAGDFLAGEQLDWVDQQRQWARGLVLHALDELRTEAVISEDWPSLFRWCHRTLEIEPCHEQTYQVLMQLHGERGELGRVRDWYDLCLRRLRSELDLDPSARTATIAAALLTRPSAVRPAAAVPPPRLPAPAADRT